MSGASRILIVEDHETLGENLRNFLSRGTPDVRLALDAGRALEVLASFTPEVVVLDYGLPGMNGLETYAAIQRHCERHVGCVMITGYPREKVAPGANERGIRHVLSKPFGLSELRNLVDRCAAEDCANPLVPFVRCGESRRVRERRRPGARGRYLTWANGDIIVGVERRRGERRGIFMRRRGCANGCG